MDIIVCFIYYHWPTELSTTIVKASNKGISFRGMVACDGPKPYQDTSQVFALNCHQSVDLHYLYCLLLPKGNSQLQKCIFS